MTANNNTVREQSQSSGAPKKLHEHFSVFALAVWAPPQNQITKNKCVAKLWNLQIKRHFDFPEHRHWKMSAHHSWLQQHFKHRLYNIIATVSPPPIPQTRNKLMHPCESDNSMQQLTSHSLVKFMSFLMLQASEAVGTLKC